MIAEKYTKEKQITVLQMLPELESGGVERGTLELGEYLVNNGHRSLVVSGGGRLVDSLVEKGSSHIDLPVGKKTPACLGCILPMRKLLLQERVDILHLRSRLPAWVGYLAWKSLPANRRPILVTTFHGFYSVNKYSAIMAKGETVIAISNVIREHIAEEYGRTDGVTTIFRGVDRDTFSPEAVSPGKIASLRADWHLSDSRKVIMLPGRLTRLKGHTLFIKALAALKEQDFIAVIVGDTHDNPGYVEELQQLILNEGLSGRVKFVGHCGDMPAAYMLADYVVSATSSEPEAFGRVSIEAMAMGKPIIATAHGGSLETVVHEQTGWLVDPRDHADMSQVLGKALALSDEEAAAVGERGRERVLTHFTTQAMCEKTLEVYQRLIAGRMCEDSGESLR